VKKEILFPRMVSCWDSTRRQRLVVAATAMVVTAYKQGSTGASEMISMLFDEKWDGWINHQVVYGQVLKVRP